MVHNNETREDRLVALQQAVVDVAALSRGASVEETLDRLRCAIATRGLQMLPESWLAAVAYEAVGGRTYVVSQEAWAKAGEYMDAMELIQHGALNGDPTGQSARHGDQAN